MTTEGNVYVLVKREPDGSACDIVGVTSKEEVARAFIAGGYGSSRAFVYEVPLDSDVRTEFDPWKAVEFI